jgi:hypothetical protein
MRPHGWLGVWLVLAGTTSPALGQVKLQWHLKEGDKFYLEEKTVQKQTLKFMGSVFTQDLSHTRVTRFTVLKKSEVSLVLQQKIEKVRIDRASGASQTDARLLRDLEGATFQVTLDAHMRLTRFEGYEDFVKKFMKNETVAKMVRVLLPEETFSRPTEALFGTLPEQAVDKGGSWQRERIRPLGALGSLKLAETCTFQGAAKGEGKDVVRIDVALTGSTYVPPPKKEFLEFRVVKGDLRADKAKTSRTFYFNTATGRLLHTVGSLHVAGRLTLKAMDKTLDTDVEQDESVTVRLLDKNPLG